MKKIGVISLGCAKNKVDTEVMLGRLTQQGFSISNKAQDVDVLIINTCGFIDTAKEESIDTIVEFAEYKKRGSLKKLIVMGCLSQRYGRELIKEIPEIDCVVGSGDIDSVSKILELKDAIHEEQKRNYVDKPSFVYNDAKRVLTTPAGSAYVKIAEGCSSKCSFCIIPKLRGPLTSRPVESIIKEIEYLAGEEIKEVNIIAQDTTAYGRDLGIKEGLTGLLKRIAAIDGIEWIRLLYSHPAAITRDLIEVVRKEEKVCKYFDIPLQHSHDAMLKAMGRPETESKIRETIREIRSHIPNISLRTTFMVGFPGETEDHFIHLCDFIEDIQFDHLGVFQFSKEEGTPAFSLSGDVSDVVKDERYRKIMEIQKGISLKNNIMRTGKVFPVLIEGKVDDEERTVSGRLSTQAPEVDGVVCVDRSEAQIGEMISVKITGALEYDLIGEEVGN